MSKTTYRVGDIFVHNMYDYTQIYLIKSIISKEECCEMEYLYDESGTYHTFGYAFDAIDKYVKDLQWTYYPVVDSDR